MDNHRKQKSSLVIPVGIEKVLYLAATDPEFKKKLLSDRDAALESIKELDDSDRSILANVRSGQLELMIDGIDVGILGRRGFVATMAAATAGLAVIALQDGCNFGGTGIGPRLPDGGFWAGDAGSDAGKKATAAGMEVDCECGGKPDGECICSDDEGISADADPENIKVNESFKNGETNEKR